MFYYVMSLNNAKNSYKLNLCKEIKESERKRERFQFFIDNNNKSNNARIKVFSTLVKTMQVDFLSWLVKFKQDEDAKEYRKIVKTFTELKKKEKKVLNLFNSILFYF